jgi:hypothetical protein
MPDRAWSAVWAPLLARLSDAGFDSITKDVAFELSKCGEHAGESTRYG